MYSFGNPESCGHEEGEGCDEPTIVFSLLEVFITNIHSTSTSSIAIGRPWDIDCPLELDFKRISEFENICDSDGDSKLIVSEGKVMFTWGKGDTGCLGFGDEEDL